MFFRWLRLYVSRQPLILKLSVIWLGGLVFGFFFTPLLALAQALLSSALLFLPTPRPSFSSRLFLLVFSLGLLRAAFSPVVQGPPARQGTPTGGVTGAVFGRLDYPRVVKGGSFFARQRQKLADLLAAYLPEPEASLAAGIVLGKKTSLAGDFGENLRRTGLTHVVVVSGYNISIVVFFMMALTRFLGKRLNFFLTAAVAVLYALLCGGGWPVWRAVLMASFVLLAKVGGREKEALSALFLSAAFLTWLQPQSLRDLSFQLSFLAALGLLLFSEPLLSWLAAIWPRRWRSKTLAEGLATTLAAQIATFPVLVYNFGQVSLVAPLTNFLIFAVIPYMMWLSLALLLAALAAPVLAPAFAALAYLPLTYFVRLAGFFGQFSWALLRF